MSRIPFIHARFPDPDETEIALARRLRDHLRKLRAARLALSEDEGAEDDEMASLGCLGSDLGNEVIRLGSVELSERDSERIDRRVRCLHKARIAATGLSHLKKEERSRLEVLKGGVELAEICSEHRADELASELHAEFPWLAEATQKVWHAMRRSIREGWPGLRLPPLLLDGPPGIGKSVWARKLAALIDAPSMVFEASNESASFGLVGSQRGWSNAAPGRVLQTILQTQIGNPIVVVDEVEKAGSVLSSNGRSFDLSMSLLPLLEQATAGSWSCPFFEVRFDMSWIGWVLTSNNYRNLPEPLLSRCPPIRLSDPTLEHLIGFARLQGQKRSLSNPSVDAVTEAIQEMSHRQNRIDLRTVIRMLERAEQLEAEPVKQ